MKVEVLVLESVRSETSVYAKIVAKARKDSE